MAVSLEVSSVPAKTQGVLFNTLSIQEKWEWKVSHTYCGNSQIGVVEIFFKRKDQEQEQMLPTPYKPPGQNNPDTLHSSAFNKYVMSYSWQL